ncbi:MAG: sigma-70 family RNA polymerase sigma factor [Deltaproteobacteria bacterium]|nr:sigma-70 family RNA polymerase sigma factor [Deltaproteobacteria bacterium]
MTRGQAPEASDDALLARARGGDRAALEALLVRHQPRVYRFGMKMCRDPEDASDVLQETLLTMARTVRDFRGASSVSTWLYTIARSFCIKKRRRSKFAPEALESLEGELERDGSHPPDPARGPEEELAGRQIEAALEAAISALEPMNREVLVLRDIEGLTAPEAAEVLGIGVDAVKSRLHRARVAVRNQVGPLLGVREAAPRVEGCPDVPLMFSRYLEGEISPDVCARMERHLEGCGSCRGACESLKRTLALCRATPAPQVPDDVLRAVREALRTYLDAS